MKTVDRRTFLRGVLTVVGAQVIPANAITLPILYGDGIHDDAPALTALLNDRPYHCENAKIIHQQDTSTQLANGVFLVKTPIKITGNFKTISDCRFIASDDFEGDIIFHMTNVRYVSVIRNVFSFPTNLKISRFAYLIDKGMKQ